MKQKIVVFFSVACEEERNKNNKIKKHTKIEFICNAIKKAILSKKEGQKLFSFHLVIDRIQRRQHMSERLQQFCHLCLLCF